MAGTVNPHDFEGVNPWPKPPVSSSALKFISEESNRYWRRSNWLFNRL